METDQRGHFRFSTPTPGGVGLTAFAKGYSLGGWQQYLQEGEVLDNLKIRLTRPTDLRLRITGPDGKAVEAAGLATLMWKTPQTDWCWLPLDLLQREKIPLPSSDRDGVVTLAGLPRDAVCRGVLEHPGLAHTSFDMARTGGDPVPLPMERGSPLTILAIDGASGKPAPHAHVTIQGLPGSTTLYTEPMDAHGQVVVRLAKTPRLSIRVSDPELLPRRTQEDLDWNGMETNTIRFELFCSARVRGRVLDARTGKPAPGVTVGLDAGASPPAICYFGCTDEAGRYEIEGPKGRGKVHILSGGGYWAEENAWVWANLDPVKPFQADVLKVKRLPMARGKVLMPDGRPLAGALVLDRTPLGGGTSCLTDREGRFEYQVEAREPQEFVSVEASHLRERFSGAGSISLEDLQAGKEMRIVLRPEFTLCGKVVGAYARPLAHVPVWLRIGRTWENGGSSYSTGASAFTNERGEYRFHGLNRSFEYQVALDPDIFSRDAPRTKWTRPAGQKETLEDLQATKGVRPRAAEPDLPAAPELRCQGWLNSPPLRLESLRGKVVLLDFWATWCGPCVGELPTVQMAHELFADKGLVVIGVHHHSVPLEKVRTFLRQKRLTFPVGLDNADGATCGQYEVRSYPTKVLIDRRGRILQKVPRGDVLSAVRRAVLYSEDSE